MPIISFVIQTPTPIVIPTKPILPIRESKGRRDWASQTVTYTISPMHIWSRINNWNMRVYDNLWGPPRVNFSLPKPSICPLASETLQELSCYFIDDCTTHELHSRPYVSKETPLFDHFLLLTYSLRRNHSLIHTIKGIGKGNLAEPSQRH